MRKKKKRRSIFKPDCVIADTDTEFDDSRYCSIIKNIFVFLEFEDGFDIICDFE